MIAIKESEICLSEINMEEEVGIPSSNKIQKQLKLSMNDDRAQVADNSSYPYSCIGLITCKKGETHIFGTGFFIGPRIVLTCAHNLYCKKTHQENTDF